MFGSMDFGMQSWVYKKSPRKPFADRERIPSFESLPKYNNVFVLKHHEVNQKRYYGLLMILIVLIAVVLSAFYYCKFDTYSSKQTKLVNERMVIENREAFDYLFNSGCVRLRNNNISGAYSEFILAYQIDSDNETLNQLIIETLWSLCDKHDRYCIKLDTFLEKI